MTTIRDLATEHSIELTTGTGHWFEAGSGEPTIFLHGVGYTAGGAEWLGCVQAGLGDATRVIAMDQFGFGPLNRPAQRYEFGHLVDRVRELQDALGLERTNIVGHSLGGWIAATLAYESPERVDRLVLVANAGLKSTARSTVQNPVIPTSETIEQGAAAIADDELRAVLLEQRLRNAAVPTAEAAFRGVTEMLADAATRQRYHLGRRLPHLRAETLVILGDRDPRYTPQDDGVILQREIPRNRLVVLPDTGHGIPTERPRELAELVGDFLR